jgi:methionyl-tRNA synthetase
VLNTASEWLLLLARQMAPFMPQKAQALYAMLGQAGAVTDLGWPSLPGAGWRAELGGTALGEVAGLFDKLDDATIEAELANLAARTSS